MSIYVDTLRVLKQLPVVFHEVQHKVLCFFLFYINQLRSVFSKSVVHHFAEDTNLLVPAKKLGTTESVINRELKLLVQRLRSNKLSLNETKT